MNVEYTGRQFQITPAIRKQVEQGLHKLTRILGDNFETHVILTAEKYRHIAEISVIVRDKPIVGLADATEMMIAVGDALSRIERQALNTRRESDFSGRRMMWYCASSQDGRRSPSIETISSPGWRPAFSAGDPGSTAPMIGRS